MQKKILIGLAIAAALLLFALVVWYLEPPPPEICLDGACYRLKF